MADTDIPREFMTARELADSVWYQGVRDALDELVYRAEQINLRDLNITRAVNSDTIPRGD